VNCGLGQKNNAIHEGHKLTDNTSAAECTTLDIAPADFSKTIHDMNNSLGNVLGGVDLLAIMLKDSGEREILDDVLQAALNVAEHSRKLQGARRR
jgi:hypothetical protein